MSRIKKSYQVDYEKKSVHGIHLASCVPFSQKNYCHYAPDLPVDWSDKAKIRENLEALFVIQDSLTEMELLNTVLKECPNLLSEVPLLSWRGLRNSLLYLFGDVIILDENMIKSNRKV